MADVAHTLTPGRRARPARIKALRRTLPALAGLLLAVCAAEVAWRTLRTDSAGLTASAEAVSMTAPRFYGTNRSGHSFVITGREGRREGAGDGVRIADPVIDISQDDGGNRRLKARSGLYKAGAHNLLLEGGVQMLDASGAELASEQAVVDTQTGQVTGQAGLKARNDVGEVSSKSYDIQDRGDRVVFKGGVKARLPSR